MIYALSVGWGRQTNERSIKKPRHRILVAACIFSDRPNKAFGLGISNKERNREMSILQDLLTAQRIAQSLQKVKLIGDSNIRDEGRGNVVMMNKALPTYTYAFSSNATAFITNHLLGTIELQAPSVRGDGAE